MHGAGAGARRILRKAQYTGGAAKPRCRSIFRRKMLRVRPTRGSFAGVRRKKRAIKSTRLLRELAAGRFASCFARPSSVSAAAFNFFAVWAALSKRRACRDSATSQLRLARQAFSFAESLVCAASPRKKRADFRLPAPAALAAYLSNLTILRTIQLDGI